MEINTVTHEQHNAANPTDGTTQYGGEIAAHAFAVVSYTGGVEVVTKEAQAVDEFYMYDKPA